MKKSYLFIALAATMFVACSDNDLTEAQKVKETTAAEAPLTFEAITQRTTTRSGYSTSPIGNAQLQSTGFGVFAYYTNNNVYDQQSSPNFMYNQEVKWATSKWTYEPAKYWPNEYGDNAISDDVDKVSFFAYAPYVDAAPATGKVDDATYGIAGLSRNTATGDPIVKYIATFDVDKAVDLCWGVVGRDATAWLTTQPEGTSYTQEMAAGKPWKDVRRPGTVSDTQQKLKFNFNHALAKLNVTIDTYADKATEVANPDTKSKVYVRSITFTGFAMKGALNLNNETAFEPKWLDFNGTNELETGDEVTIYDGRKDGKEGVKGAIANNEKVLGLNPNIISNDNNTTTGVNATPVSLFRKLEMVGAVAGVHWTQDEIDAAAPSDPAYGKTTDDWKTEPVAGTPTYHAATTEPIYIIPSAGDEVTVTIVYDIETEDANLPTLLSDGKIYGSSIENRITKTITFGDKSEFEAGKSYTIALHLGMNSVKFDADIIDWEDTPEIPVELPSNLPTYAATGAGASYDLTLPAATTSYQFAVSGLNGGESLEGTEDGTVVTAITTPLANANTAGIAVETITVAPNTTVKHKTGSVTLSGQASGKSVTISVKSQAHVLGLGASASGTTISLTSSATGINWAETDAAGTSKTFIVKKNGVELEYVSGAGAIDASQFTFDTSTGKITLGEDASSGDVFTITIQAGDAEEETISFKVS